MNDLIDLETFTLELAAQGISPDDSRADAVLDQAAGIASDYCGKDLTKLSPVPQTIQRVVLDLATAIYHAAGRDAAVTQEETEGVGSTSFGVTRWTDRLADLDPWRAFNVA